jgi:hypothetical protein
MSMTSGDSTSPAMNPIVQDLLNAGPNLLMIGGYVGPARDRHIRLYADLRLSKYIEIPTEDVVRIVQEPEQSEKPCILFFKSTAELTYVQTASIRADQAMAMAASRCTGCGGSGGRSAEAAREVDGGGPTISICGSQCQEGFGLCALGASSWQKLWCVLGYGVCRFACIIEDMGPVIV